MKCPIMQRMKENYETRSRSFLTRRTPVIMRLDGKAFHTYTRGLDRPFDEGLIEDMANTAVFLCQEIQGAKCAYVQSDEINILITDYDNLQTNAWFNYAIQKMTSVSASVAAAKFNQLRSYRYLANIDADLINMEYAFNSTELTLAFFDSRVFNIPIDEVSNYFIGRQRDAVRNSISMLAQSLYSHNELHKKSTSDMQELSFQKGHNWNDLHWTKKRGYYIVKNTYVNDKLIANNKLGEYTFGDIIYDSHIESSFYENQQGRLLEYCKGGEKGEDWYEVKIDKVRTKWESIETPVSFSEESFKSFL